MGLAGTAVPGLSHIPRAVVLLFQRLTELRSALLLKSGMTSSLFSNSHINLIKIDGVTSCWPLWVEDSDVLASRHTANTQIKRDWFILPCYKPTSFSSTRFE